MEVSNRNIIAVRRALAQNRRHPRLLSFPVLQCFVTDVKTPQGPEAAPLRGTQSVGKGTQGVFTIQRMCSRKGLVALFFSPLAES